MYIHVDAGAFRIASSVLKEEKNRVGIVRVPA